MSFIEGECTESDYINTDGELNVKIKTLSYYPTIGDNNIYIELNYDLFINNQFLSNNSLTIFVNEMAL